MFRMSKLYVVDKDAIRIGYTRTRYGEALAALAAELPVAPSAEGTRLTLAFSAEQTTAAALIRSILARTEVVDLSVEEPDIDAVVARFYEGQRPAGAPAVVP